MIRKYGVATNLIVINNKNSFLQFQEEQKRILAQKEAEKNKELEEKRELKAKKKKNDEE